MNLHAEKCRSSILTAKNDPEAKIVGFSQLLKFLDAFERYHYNLELLQMPLKCANHTYICVITTNLKRV